MSNSERIKYTRNPESRKLAMMTDHNGGFQGVVFSGGPNAYRSEYVENFLTSAIRPENIDHTLIVADFDHPTPTKNISLQELKNLAEMDPEEKAKRIKNEATNINFARRITMVVLPTKNTSVESPKKETSNNS